MRLDLALIRQNPGLSRRRAQAAIEKGQVTVDGARVREAGFDVSDEARISWDPNRKALPRARSALPVLYQDDHVLVVDKPAGLLTVPAGPRPADEDSALGHVRDYVRRLRPRGGFVERVHRLDRNTTGAVAFALSREARAALIQLFRTHAIERRYVVVVAGSPRSEEGVVDAPLRDAWVSGRKAVAREGEAQKPARTRWRVRERLEGATVLEVTLDTGRQHQIRVHLAHIGLPVLGDRVYGHPDRQVLPAPRPLLHAGHLAFAHPMTGQRVAVESPLPGDFTRAVARLRARAPKHKTSRRKGDRGRRENSES
jgi:23S rRNA pseudouridine1911/1915/1917 synthase